MADEFNTRNTTTAMKTEDMNATATPPAETTTDRGLFDFVKNKKDDHGQEKVMTAAGSNDTVVSEHEDKEKKHDEGILGKLHRSGSNSSSSLSSSSDEEKDDDEKKKKKKKKSLKDKIKDHLPAKTDEQKEEEKKIHLVEEEKYSSDHQHHQNTESAAPEKKGMFDKIKDHLPAKTGNDEQKKGEKKIHHVEEEKYSSDHQHHQNTESAAPGKKGMFDKIKDKFPGHHDDADDTKTKNPDHENYDQKTAAAPYGHHDNHSAAAPPHSTAAGGVMEEKKGFFDKIKERIPGFHSKTTDDDKRAGKVVKDTEKRDKDYDSA